MAKVILDDSWLMRAFPELRQIEDPSERLAVWQAAFHRMWWRWSLIIFVMVVGGLWAANTATSIIAPSLRRISESAPLILSGVAGVAIGPIGMLVAWRLCKRQLQRSIRRQILQRGRAVCMRCGYDLQGLTEARCPECGMGFDPILLGNRSGGGTG